MSGRTNNQTFLQSGPGAVARTNRDKLRESFSVKDVSSEIGDSRLIDATSAFQSAIDSGARRITVPFSPYGYKLSSTLFITTKDGFALEFEVGPIGQNNTSQLLWYGGAAPVIQVRGVVGASLNLGFGVELKNVSIDGIVGGTRATCGIAFGQVGIATNELFKFIQTENIRILNCRVGAWFGNSAGTSPDIATHVHQNWIVTRCIDHGLLINSGNAAGLNFLGCTWSSNGYNPTNDAVNGASGAGSNVAIMAGGGNFHGCSSAGLGADTPATADILCQGNDLVLNGWWSDTHGTCLLQSGPIHTLILNGLRHYEGSMTEVNTPTSIRCSAKATIVGGFLFGDVYGISGNSGSLTPIGVEFKSDNLATMRPTLGIGKFKGDIVTTYHGLVSINNLGNTAQIAMGGAVAAKQLAHIGYAVPQLLALGTDGLYSAFSILQALGPGATDSGFSLLGPDPNFGALEFMVNGYVYDAASNIRAHKPGSVFRIVLGYVASTAGLAVYHYDFPDTTTSIPLSSFVKVTSLLQGVGTGGEKNQFAQGFPMAASDPSFSSGDWWEGSVYYNTTAKKLRVNTGAGTWVDLH